MRHLAIVLSLLVLSTNAFAEEAPDPAEEQVVPIERGERAPFSGQLFPTALAIRMGFRVERLQLQLRADVERAEAICQAHRDYDARVLTLEQERRDFEIERLEQRSEELAEELAQERDVPFYRTWSFGFAMGIVASVLLVGGAVALMIGLT